MRIGIIGAGAMAAALGGGWAAACHEVSIGARSADSARALAAEITAAHGDVHAATIDAAIAFADVVLLAVPVSALTELLSAHGPDLAGKIVIDCTNAFLPDESAPEGVTAFVLSEDAVAERIATAAPKAHVVKAFNLLAAEVWAGTDRVFDGARLAVPICGDDVEAVRTVARLAEDLALRPFPAGGLHRARYLEATSVFTVGLWFGGLDARAMLPPLWGGGGGPPPRKNPNFMGRPGWRPAQANHKPPAPGPARPRP
ncbi:NADPH-dependent F420 reductase, partial [Nocardia sp. NPDC058518]|uniref:NADPH-dependent F420 reductase n=1 Tax=Nocardia sp. NPDC058518 TaxID=3346534 RepID=UPI003661A3A0